MNARTNPATDPWSASKTDPSASSPDVPLSIDVYHRAIGTAGEASERPGETSPPNTAEGNLPSTIASNYPYNQTIGPPNPFATSEIPRPFGGITFNSLQLPTGLTAPVRPTNRNVLPPQLQ